VADLHDATEHYLVQILELEEEGVVPLRARLVERLGLSAPTVSETVQRLIDHGYVAMRSPGHRLELTEPGAAIATSVVRRHRLAERLLLDVIGLEWDKVHREADRWEHVISPDVEERLVELLDDPASCPHGNPIPGSSHAGRRVPAVALASAPTGPTRVARINEKLELDDEGLRLVARLGLIPGQPVEVLGRGADGVRVRTGGREHTVPTALAGQILVESRADVPAERIPA
jgi:DtxR family transcriptional regulator, Mn-dependent transcriptional regulator